MKIVYLDGHTLNPGDLSWDDLKALGDCAIYDRTPAAQVAERIAGFDVVLTNKAPIDRASIESNAALKLISVTATGYNVVDAAAAKERRVVVSNVPEYGTPNVAQAVFALILELTNHVGHHARTVREGRWAKSIDWCYWDTPLVELNGLTLGIVGYGRIGAAVGKIARGFGMKVIAHRGQPVGDDPVRLIEMDALVRDSDVITLHCPLTPENRLMINADLLSRMKPNAMLINTARGALIDEPALAKALNESQIAGAGLDVLTTEPPAAGNPLFSAKNCIITPHVAWASCSARRRLLRETIENIQAFLDGEPRHVVNS